MKRDTTQYKITSALPKQEHRLRDEFYRLILHERNIHTNVLSAPIIVGRSRTAIILLPALTGAVKTAQGDPQSPFSSLRIPINSDKHLNTLLIKPTLRTECRTVRC